MNASPYRMPASISSEADAAEPEPPTELLPFFTMLWVASLARVLVALLHQETFAAEPTLAFLLVLVLPWLVKDELFAVTSPRRRA
jgi:hypothetical protein